MLLAADGRWKCGGPGDDALGPPNLSKNCFKVIGSDISVTSGVTNCQQAQAAAQAAKATITIMALFVILIRTSEITGSGETR